MSEHNYCFTGYGFSIDDANVENIVSFIRKHRSDICDKISVPENVSAADFVKAVGKQAGEGSWKGIVTKAMTEETGIQFELAFNEETEAIILPCCLPWQYVEKEKDLTQEEMDRILRGYMDELGIDGVPDTIQIFGYF